MGMLHRSKVTALGCDMSCEGLHGEGEGIRVIDEDIDPHGEAARREASNLRRPRRDRGRVRSRAAPASDGPKGHAQYQARQSPDHIESVAAICASEQSFAIPSIHG